MMDETDRESGDHDPQPSFDRHEQGTPVEEVTTTKTGERPNWLTRYSIAAIISAPFVYLLSSGPVMATAFWLRDRTDWDGFYAIMWIYYPLLANYPLTYPFHLYLEWWCRLFGTMPPG